MPLLNNGLRYNLHTKPNNWILNPALEAETYKLLASCQTKAL
jgi:hypothetical protein